MKKGNNNQKDHSARYVKPSIPFSLHFDHLGVGVFDDKKILKISDGNSFALGRVHKNQDYLPRLSLVRLHEPIQNNGKIFHFVVRFEKCDVVTREPFQTVKEIPMPGNKSMAKMLFEELDV